MIRVADIARHKTKWVLEQKPAGRVLVALQGHIEASEGWKEGPFSRGRGVGAGRCCCDTRGRSGGHRCTSGNSTRGHRAGRLPETERETHNERETEYNNWSVWMSACLPLSPCTPHTLSYPGRLWGWGLRGWWGSVEGWRWVSRRGRWAEKMVTGQLPLPEDRPCRPLGERERIRWHSNG